MEERGRFYVVMRQTMTLIYWPFSRITAVSRYQNVSTLDFIGAKDDGGGGDNWSYIIFRVIAGKKIFGLLCHGHGVLISVCIYGA